MPPKKKARVKAPRPHVAHGTGRPIFPTLPVELIYAIIDHCTNGHWRASSTLDRDDLLFALSRTCQRLRYITLDMKWALFDVTATRYVGDWSTGIANDLERKSDVLAGLKHLHPLVKSVRVILTRRRSDAVLGSFAKVLEQLTSVTTLEIVWAQSSITTHLEDAFEGYTFPSIRTVIAPAQAHNLLRCCVGVRTVVANDGGYESSKLISAISSACKQVEEVDYVALEAKTNLKRLLKHVPNLRKVRFVNGLPYKTFLDQLKPFKRLNQLGVSHVEYIPPPRELDFVLGHELEPEPPAAATLTRTQVMTLGKITEFITAARAFLKGRGGGSIVVDHRRTYGYFGADPTGKQGRETMWTHIITIKI